MTLWVIDAALIIIFVWLFSLWLSRLENKIDNLITFVRKGGEQLLELVNHQQQLPAVLRRRAIRVGRRAARLRQRRLSRGEREPSRIGVKPAPHLGRIRASQPGQRLSRPRRNVTMGPIRTVRPS